jgi:hypothetical protein
MAVHLHLPGRIRLGGGGIGDTEWVVWLCTKGPGDSVGTTATFLISTSDDRTLLELKHSGWPGTHGNFRKCNTIWAVLLHHIQQYVQTGTPATAFD